MVRKALQVAVFLLLANAVYQAAPVSLRHYQFKDSLQELALFSQKLTDAELIDRVMVLAEEHSIPLDREYVAVRHANGQLVITASYVEAMKFVPGYDYVRQFDVVARRFDSSR
jgi:uncharacterized protein (UPF0248 family)